MTTPEKRIIICATPFLVSTRHVATIKISWLRLLKESGYKRANFLSIPDHQFLLGVESRSAKDSLL